MKELSKVVLRTNHAIRNQLQVILCGLDVDASVTQKEVAEKAVSKIVKGLLEVEQLIADTEVPIIALSEEGPIVTRADTSAMQVCVPSNYTDTQVLEFANLSNPCGTVCGWVIRAQGHELLAGAEEREKCKERDNYIHIMLDA